MHIYIYLIIFCFLLYFLTIFGKKYIISYFAKLNKLYFNFKIIGKYNDVNKLYNLIILVLCLWIVIFYKSKVKFPFNTIYIIRKDLMIYIGGIALIFFLLGLFFARGKKIIKAILKNTLYFTKTLILTDIHMLLFTFFIVTKNYLNLTTLLITLVNLICLGDYLIYFQKEKNKMINWEFLFSFIWLLLISFCNNFILIYNLLNI